VRIGTQLQDGSVVFIGKKHCALREVVEGMSYVEEAQEISITGNLITRLSGSFFKEKGAEKIRAQVLIMAL
jgi:actin-related protein